MLRLGAGEDRGDGGDGGDREDREDGGDEGDGENERTFQVFSNQCQ